MTISQIIIDLNFGDSGKGATVDYLCSKNFYDLVVKYNGGFQAAHNVVLPDGKHHCFSQFGSGTLRGVRTFLDENFIIDPLSLATEARHLSDLGIKDVYDFISVNENCLVSTIYHKNLNRYLDSINQHGSCGVGIGATRQMWSETGDGLFASDLKNKKLINKKLNWIRQWCADKLIGEYSNRANILDINIDWNKTHINHILEINDLFTLSKPIIITDRDAINKYRSIIFEGSQGFGLDQLYGTIPHTTYSDTTPRYAVELCDEFDLKYETIGVTRAYGTRHGNGPLYGEGNANISNDIETDHNFNGAYAGKFRHGHLHLSQIEKAIRTCGATKLAVTCLDHRTIEDQADVLRQLNELCPVWLTSYGKTANDRRLYGS